MRTLSDCLRSTRCCRVSRNAWSRPSILVTVPRFGRPLFDCVFCVE